MGRSLPLHGILNRVDASPQPPPLLLPAASPAPLSRLPCFSQPPPAHRPDPALLTLQSLREAAPMLAQEDAFWAPFFQGIGGGGGRGASSVGQT